MNFEDIRKANETITTTNIKGKEYADVAQRIKAFRMVYPTGYINTEMLSNENGMCIFRAVCGNDGEILGSGHAYEKESSSYINKTSYIENCETSAVGRALGMAGFGIDTSVCSAEELQNALLNQNPAPEKKPAPAKKVDALASDEEKKRLTEYCRKYEVDMKWIAKEVGIQQGKMTKSQYVKAMNIINDMAEEKEDEE